MTKTVIGVCLPCQAVMVTGVVKQADFARMHCGKIATAANTIGRSAARIPGTTAASYTRRNLLMIRNQLMIQSQLMILSQLMTLRQLMILNQLVILNQLKIQSQLMNQNHLVSPDRRPDYVSHGNLKGNITLFKDLR